MTGGGRKRGMRENHSPTGTNKASWAETEGVNHIKTNFLFDVWA